MTTIAYRNGVLAADTRETEKDTIYSDRVRKVHKLRDGSLYAAAGSGEACEMLLQSLIKRTKCPAPLDVEALHVKPDGSLWVCAGNAWLPMDYEPYYAMGSGATVALAAMDAGADAVKAVRIAIKRNTHTGGRVQHVKLRRKRKKR
jgi:20S proteasome alpha/beta subunit